MTNPTHMQTVRAIHRHLAGGMCPNGDEEAPCFDAFVAELAPGLHKVLLGTYLGKKDTNDEGHGIAVDSQG